MAFHNNMFTLLRSWREKRLHLTRRDAEDFPELTVIMLHPGAQIRIQPHLDFGIILLLGAAAIIRFIILVICLPILASLIVQI